MPQERNNPYPSLTREDWEQIKRDNPDLPRETLAARVIAANRVPGIPHRPYLKGESDHAPLLQGIAAFAAKVYALADLIDGVGGLHPGRSLPNEEEWGKIIDANAEIVSMMEEVNL